ncbi:hypothetical protein D9M71_638220 [compost metagenome]
MASALTKPVRTELLTKRISTPNRSTPNNTWNTPANRPAANRYGRPCALTKGAATSATEPAAAVIIAGRPPNTAMTMLNTNDANRPTCGSTPATNEKAMTSGISANVATAPASISRRGWARHCASSAFRKDIRACRQCLPRLAWTGGIKGMGANYACSVEVGELSLSAFE